MSTRRQRQNTIVVIALVAAVVGFVSSWAGTGITQAAAPGSDTRRPTYEVASGTVGRSLHLSATIAWDTIATVRSRRSGVITSLGSTSSSSLQAGDVVVTVDLQPVFAAAGSVPAFRDLVGDEQGADVAQVKAWLRSLGYATSDSDVFDPTAIRAVSAFQRDHGLVPSGVLAKGDVVFLPVLPARVRLGSGIEVGAPLAEGDVMLEAVDGTPSFIIRLGSEQSELVPADASGTLHLGDADLPFVTTVADRSGSEAPQSGSMSDGSTSQSTSTDEVLLRLAAPDGSPLCPGPCLSVAGTGSTVAPVDVVVVPEATGPVVPLGAVRTRGPDVAFIVTPDGREHPVEILVSDGGIAVVSGIRPGVEILMTAARR